MTEAVPVIPAASAGMHDHPHSHDEFSHHDHGDIRGEIEALRGEISAREVVKMTEDAAAASAVAAVAAEDAAFNAESAVAALAEEMRAGFSELRELHAQSAAPPVVAVDSQVGDGVEPPAPAEHSGPPKERRRRDTFWPG